MYKYIEAVSTPNERGVKNADTVFWMKDFAKTGANLGE